MHVDSLPASIRELAMATCVHVYNVSPWKHESPQGSLGTFFIPACPKGQEFARMKPIPGIVYEVMPNNADMASLRLETGNEARGGSSGGRYIAEQILGSGAHQDARGSLVRRGVFIGSEVGPNANPTKQELAKARATLNEYYNYLVAEARSAYAAGPAMWEAARRDEHFVAAAALNLEDEPWAKNHTSSIERKKCPVCAQTTDKDAIRCATAGCGYVFDMEAWKRLVASGAMGHPPQALGR